MQSSLCGLEVFCYLTAVAEEKSSYIFNLFWPSGHQLFDFRCLDFNKLSPTGGKMQQLMWLICHLQLDYGQKENQSYLTNLLSPSAKLLYFFPSMHFTAEVSISRSILPSLLSLYITRHLITIGCCCLWSVTSFQLNLMGCFGCFQNYTQSETFILSNEKA